MAVGSTWARACVGACVSASDLSSKRGASGTSLKTLVGRARPEMKPTPTRTRYGQPIKLAGYSYACYQLTAVVIAPLTN